MIPGRGAPQALLCSAIRNLLPLSPGQHLLPCRSLESAPSSFASAAWHHQQQIFRFATTSAQESTYGQTDLMSSLPNLKARRSLLNLQSSHPLINSLQQKCKRQHYTFFIKQKTDVQHATYSRAALLIPQSSETNTMQKDWEQYRAVSAAQGYWRLWL